jgi:hypothetical protein
MESVTAGQAPHIIVVLQCIQADGACITRLSQQFRCDSGSDRVVIIGLVAIILVVVVTILSGIIVLDWYSRCHGWCCFLGHCLAIFLVTLHRPLGAVLLFLSSWVLGRGCRGFAVLTCK